MILSGKVESDSTGLSSFDVSLLANIAIDEQGFLWVSNNYVPKSRFEIACAGVRLLKFYPWGENFPRSPYFGGGLEGAGLGISIAPNGHIWVGNFGFQAPGCALPATRLASPFRMTASASFAHPERFG